MKRNALQMLRSSAKPRRVLASSAGSGNYRKQAERPHSARGRMEGLLMFDYRNRATEGIGALA